MANSYSTQDLIKDVLVNCGERTDGTSPYHSLALKFINDVYKALLSGPTVFDAEIGDVWSWARITRTLTVLGSYNVGTVAVTAGSAVATFSVAPTISLQGYDINFTNINSLTWYNISQHTAGATTFTLNSVYSEDTAGSALAFMAAPLVNDLGPGVLRVLEAFRIYKDRVLDYGEKAEDQGHVYGISTQDFWRSWPLRYLVNDIPGKFTTISTSESSWLVRFNKYVTNPLKVDYDIIPIPTELTDQSNNIPLVPYAYRTILSHGAAYFLNVVKTQQTKAENYFKVTAAEIKAMHLAEEKYNKLVAIRYGQLTPRLDDSSIPWYILRP